METMDQPKPGLLITVLFWVALCVGVPGIIAAMIMWAMTL